MRTFSFEWDQKTYIKTCQNYIHCPKCGLVEDREDSNSAALLHDQEHHDKGKRTYTCNSGSRTIFCTEVSNE